MISPFLLAAITSLTVGDRCRLVLDGAVGTTLGVVIGHWAVGGQQAFGELHAALAGMFTGTCIGLVLGNYFGFLVAALLGA